MSFGTPLPSVAAELQSIFMAEPCHLAPLTALNYKKTLTAPWHSAGQRRLSEAASGGGGLSMRAQTDTGLPNAGTLYPPGVLLPLL